MKDVYLSYIQCASCDHIYSISDPVIIGGAAHIGTKVSTEIGCPKCLEPDGTIVGRIRFYPLTNDLSARALHQGQESRSSRGPLDKAV
jgi:hypothetical protein